MLHGPEGCAVVSLNIYVHVVQPLMLHIQATTAPYVTQDLLLTLRTQCSTSFELTWNMCVEAHEDTEKSAAQDHM